MTSDKAAEKKLGFWTIAAGEPFRIFFPLGLLFGISGVSLWPLFFLGIHQSFYPGVMHARMMTEGFLGGFVLGFLGTAVPRLTGTRPFSKSELFAVLVPFVTAIGTHIALRHVAGDLLFLLTLLIFVSLLLRRFRERQDLQPPGFILVVFGFLTVLVGTSLLVLGGLNAVTYRGTLLGSLLLYQGFVLHLVLGVGSFLLPRFLGIPTTEFPETRNPSRRWARSATTALICSLLLLSSFVLEVMAQESRFAYLLRWITAMAYLLWHVPFHQVAAKVTLTKVLNAALIFLVLGLAFPVFWPTQRVAGLHVVFVGGFTLITFAIATRVVLGHSGNQLGFSSQIRPLEIAAVLLVVAGVLRALGDFLPMQRLQMLNWASYLWMVAAVVWAIRILPRVRTVAAE